MRPRQKLHFSSQHYACNAKSGVGNEGFKHSMHKQGERRWSEGDGGGGGGGGGGGRV